MRILILTDIYNRPETETFIGLKKVAVDIEMLVRPEPVYPRVQEVGIVSESFIVRGRFDFKAIRHLRNKIIKGRYDILHVFNNRAASIGFLATLGLPIKIVAYRGTVGNISLFSPNSWLTYLSPKVRRVICVSEAVRQYFLQISFLGYHLDAKKFVTIHKGHELSWYQEAATDLKQFGIPEGAFVVGLTGRDRPHKGIEVLIEAVNLLPRDADVHLLLVGKMHRKKLLQKIASSPRKDNIHLAGYRQDAPQIAAACDAFALPSIAREGLPRAVIEAMAYGTPALVSDEGGNPELIEQGVSGYIHPAGDAKSLSEAIFELYSNPELRKQMGEAAQKQIDENFNNRNTVEKTLALYQDVLENP